LRWDTAVCNRWINQLPGAWTGRWRNLKVRANGKVDTDDLVTHLRASLAYLEANREAIKATRAWSWPFKRNRRQPDRIIAEFHDVAESMEKPLKKTGHAVVLIGGSKK
jgi:hypothetical protein